MGCLLTMDTPEYSKWGDRLLEDPTGMSKRTASLDPAVLSGMCGVEVWGEKRQPRRFLVVRTGDTLDPWSQLDWGSNPDSAPFGDVGPKASHRASLIPGGAPASRTFDPWSPGSRTFLAQDSESTPVTPGPWGSWGHWGRRAILVGLVLSATAVLWVIILSVLLSKASTEQGTLQDHQDLLGTKAMKLTAVLGDLKKEVTAYNSSLQGVQAQLQTTSKELKEAEVKLMEQESTLRELNDRVTQSLAKAGRDLEDIRTELFRELGSIKVGNVSCSQCPASWIPFQGSCYFFSQQRAQWDQAQRLCADAEAHLVIVKDLEEQTFLTRNTRGLGYWLGLKAVRQRGKIQHYQWVDGVSLSFRKEKNVLKRN
ncbi:C-type lectin domain family 4 member G-like isoform X3 [Erinaceus europaeus]|uniref:C-type lectin domain family 4 member G-like isoform X3 n=1 Tax=Erinaceus europaeus TaxID=9365 RepID=A0ABM3WLY3_ERIEU|nr:C-type lectin domain family 4 member G-like isoform X3 [Erinaceus europaeus]